MTSSPDWTNNSASNQQPVVLETVSLDTNLQQTFCSDQFRLGHSPLAAAGLVLLDRGTEAGLLRTREDFEVLGVKVEAAQI